jgi:chemotaxis protein MotA
MLCMTIAGMVLAIGAILTGQLLEGAKLSAMFQPVAFLMVFGGTVGAVMAQSSPKDFMLALKMLNWFVTSPVAERKDYIKEIVSWSKLARTEGALKLDNLADSIKEPMLKNGVEMIVDQLEPEFIRDTLLMDAHIRDTRLKNAAKVWESAGGYAPTIGILGSILGLLHIMGGVAEPSALGSAIAVSFVATVYGLALANLVFLPIAAKLRSMIFELTLRDELRIEGLAMIAQNKSSRMVERTLVGVSDKADNVVNFRRAA